MTLAPDAAGLARLGFRAPDAAAADLPEGWESDRRWQAVLEHLGGCADPDAGLRRLVHAGPNVVETVLTHAVQARPLLAVLGFSEHLAGVLVRQPLIAEEILGAQAFRRRDDLRERKEAELFRIAAADLSEPPTVESFVSAGRALSDLADDLVAGALAEVGAPGGLAVMAMGKYGGRELNYASDIDVLFVTDGDPEEAEAAARAFMSRMNGPPTLFRTDADLRPEGRDGPLVRSLEAFEAYYTRWAQVWEFQSLIKCRHAGGSEATAEAFLALAAPYVWPERLESGAVEQIRALKSRAEEEVSRKGLDGRQVKLGPGGIRDVEFAVQLLQLVHARERPDLRSPNTLQALATLGAEGFVAESDAEEFSRAYVFLRHAEHRLQLVHGRQTHTLPKRRREIEHLARGLGYRDSREEQAVDAFERDWRTTTTAVRSIHEKLFYRPLLEAFGALPPVGPVLAEAEGAARVRALGFDRPPVVQEAIRDLTSGPSRRAKVMRAILPGLLSWLAETADPDAGIVRLRELVPLLDSLPHLLALLRDSPPVAEILCRALGTGPVLSELLGRDPGLVATLTSPLREDREALVKEAVAVVTRARDTREAMTALRRFKEGVWMQGALVDLQAGRGGAFVQTSRSHSLLGDACLEAALAVARAEADDRYGGSPDASIAVIALGRYGGCELSHASDLDVVFVYDHDAPCPDGTEGRLYFAAVAERVVELLASPPPIFRMDTELRPEGRNGPNIRSLASYEQYYDRWAETWEFQALLRARHAAGDPAITQRLLAHVAPRVWPESLSSDRVEEIRHMKARIERERVKSREDRRSQVKLGTGGLADVEFTVQLLQMRHGHAVPAARTPNTLEAIGALGSAGFIPPADRGWLEDAYVMLNRVRNHLFLLRGLPTDSIPSRDEELERLARSLGYGRLARTTFTEDYRRVARRTRQVCDRLFYGEERDQP